MQIIFAASVGTPVLLGLMSRLISREEAFHLFAKGKSVPCIPPTDLAKALRISGSYPTEAYINNLPADAGQQTTFCALEVPPLALSFAEALSSFGGVDGEHILLEDLAYALQGSGEPLPNDQADEVLVLAREKCCDVDGRVIISRLVRAVHELYLIPAS